MSEISTDVSADRGLGADLCRPLFANNRLITFREEMLLRGRLGVISSLSSSLALHCIQVNIAHPDRMAVDLREFTPVGIYCEGAAVAGEVYLDYLKLLHDSCVCFGLVPEAPDLRICPGNSGWPQICVFAHAAVGNRVILVSLVEYQRGTEDWWWLWLAHRTHTLGQPIVPDLVFPHKDPQLLIGSGEPWSLAARSAHL